MKKTVVHYFKTHPNSNECFSTSDGFLFHTEGAALAHADSLKDKNVKGYRRDEYSDDIAKSIEEDKKAEADAKKSTESSGEDGSGAPAMTVGKGGKSGGKSGGKKTDKPGDKGEGEGGDGGEGSEGTSSGDAGSGEGK